MNKIKFLSLSLVALFMACFTACNNNAAVDYSEYIVGTWTAHLTNYAEALVFNADGTMQSHIAGPNDEDLSVIDQYFEDHGTYTLKGNKLTMVWSDGTKYDITITISPYKLLAFDYDGNGIDFDYDYCEEDLSDEIVGMWVCNETPSAEENDMLIMTYNADGTTVFTGYAYEADVFSSNVEASYKVIGDLLIHKQPDIAVEYGLAQYNAMKIKYTPNGTALGDVKTLQAYAKVGENYVETHTTWLRIKQTLDLAGKKYFYHDVFVTNVDGEDKDIPFFDTTINFAKLDNSLMNNFLSATLFSVEFPDANAMKYSFLLANNITTYPPTSIEVEGNKMTIKMSANNSVYKDVELYAFQDKDNSQLHMYMPTKSFENFFGNMQVNIMVEKGQLDLTDADAVKAVFDNIESAVETINLSLVFKAK